MTESTTETLVMLGLLEASTMDRSFWTAPGDTLDPKL